MKAYHNAAILVARKSGKIHIGANVNEKLLLDLYGNAAVAYSLRQLSNSFRSAVIRVRRSSDNSEADFLPIEITNGTLTAWVGLGDGFVTTWYDQSGSENNAVQTSAANQIKIINSGVLITQNGKPAIQSDGTDDFLNIGTKINFKSIFAVINPDYTNSSVGNYYLCGSDNDPKDYIFLSSNSFSLDGSGDATGKISINNSLLTSCAENHTISNYNSNQIIVSAFYCNDYSAEALRLLTDPVQYAAGLIQEIIFFTNDKSANNSEIQEIINNYYSIY